MDIGRDEIEQWHRERAQTEPWLWFNDLNGHQKFIGYHFVVRRSGTVELARPISKVGNHCKGNNKNSIGVVWVGRDEMTDAQRSTLVGMVANLCVHYSLSHTDVYGHCQFAANKTCPNFNSPLTFESIDHFRSEVEMAIREIK
jgi:hypothetical protein